LAVLREQYKEDLRAIFKRFNPLKAFNRFAFPSFSLLRHVNNCKSESSNTWLKKTKNESKKKKKKKFFEELAERTIDLTLTCTGKRYR